MPFPIAVINELFYCASVDDGKLYLWAAASEDDQEHQPTIPKPFEGFMHSIEMIAIGEENFVSIGGFFLSYFDVKTVVAHMSSAGAFLVDRSAPSLQIRSCTAGERGALGNSVMATRSTAESQREYSPSTSTKP
jgi:hypothetical protein